MVDEIKLEILEYSYWEHFNSLKSVALILPIEHPRRQRLEAELERIREEINNIKTKK